MELLNIRDTYLTQAARTYQILLDVDKRLERARQEVDELTSRKDLLAKEYESLRVLLQRYDIVLDALSLGRKLGWAAGPEHKRKWKALLPPETSTSDSNDAEQETTNDTEDW